MMLAPSRLGSSTGLQARGRTHRHVVAPAPVQGSRVHLKVARPALETKSDVPEAVPSQEAQPAQPVAEPTLQDKVKGALQALYQNRRLVAVGVALLDVAFLWVAIKLGKQWFWDTNH